MPIFADGIFPILQGNIQKKRICPGIISVSFFKLQAGDEAAGYPDTGGGEFLLSLHHPYENTSAAEAYPPNVQLCREKHCFLLGIDFSCRRWKKMRFLLMTAFDMVINKCGDFNVKTSTAFKKMAENFITEQVGAENDGELVELLLGKTELPFPEQYLEIRARKQFLRRRGLIFWMHRECFRPIKFFFRHRRPWSGSPTSQNGNSLGFLRRPLQRQIIIRSAAFWNKNGCVRRTRFIKSFTGMCHKK